MGFWLYQSCDIEPGATLICVYATKFDIAEQCKNVKIQSLLFTYKMVNVLVEHFSISTELNFFPTTTNEALDFVIEISPVQKIKNQEDY